MKKAKTSAKKLKLTAPEDQGPFFVVEGAGGGLFLNIIWNWGAPLDVPVAELLRLLRSAESGSMVIGRRLDRREVRLLRDARDNSDAEAFSNITPRDDLRWVRGRPRRR